MCKWVLLFRACAYSKSRFNVFPRAETSYMEMIFDLAESVEMSMVNLLNMLQETFCTWREIFSKVNDFFLHISSYFVGLCSKFSYRKLGR